ncbi:hypothetical protein [Bacillus sp. JJ1764]|uniref:hypothetical protein n=1 Tax=Bacillus sp. JJ1764 TaxID=3122964 RepID=UPI002FFFF3B5
MMNVIETNKSSLSSLSFKHVEFVPGIWIKGKCIWLQNCTEKVLVEEGIVFKIKHEQVHSRIRYTTIYVSNFSNGPKELKIVGMHYIPDFNHLAFVSPSDQRVFHIADDKILLVNGRCQDSFVKEYTTIPLWTARSDKIWSSLQTGILKYQPMAKGPAASILAFDLKLGAHETKKFNTWEIIGTNKNEILSMEKALMSV